MAQQDSTHPCFSCYHHCMVHIGLLVLVGFLGGALGAMVGLGGGVFIIPGLTLLLGVPIHSAVAASLVGVVSTSLASGLAGLRDDLANLRLGITLETTTVAGALLGGLVGTALSKPVLSAVFGGVMVAVSLYLGLNQRSKSPEPVWQGEIGRFGACYYDNSLRRKVCYRPVRMWAGLSGSAMAGVVSGLLGVGGGFLKVPVMVLAMKVPARAAIGTSQFMIGVTACAGALVYFTKGLLDPTVAVPVVLGVTPGAFLGARIGQRVKGSVLVIVLAAVLFALSVQMLLSVAGIDLR